MEETYLKAMQKSFPKMEKSDVLIKTQKDKITYVPLWFVPLGISSRNINDDDYVFITDYFMPGIAQAKVEKKDNILRLPFEWMYWAINDVSRVRLFPDLPQYGDANRGQTVNCDDNQRYWISRNASKEFVILAKSEQGQLPRLIKIVEAPTKKMIHSALLTSDALETIESSRDLEKWYYVRYKVDDYTLTKNHRVGIHPWFYGLARNSKDSHTIWTVTDFRIKKGHGIYQGDNRLIVKDIYGNGLCFLKDGSLLVTRYGYSCYEPSQLIHVPAALLK